MEKFIEDSLITLHKALMNDPRVQELDQLEKQLGNDKALLSLSKRLELAEEDYSFVCSSFPNDKQKIGESQKKLHLAKLALDEEPLAQKYNEAFKKVSYLYMEIDDVIFSPYRGASLTIKGENHD
jgi:uncharacterized membrane protein YfhO